MNTMKNIFLLLMTIALVGCFNDLDTEPKVELSLEELLASDPNAVEGILAKLYASFALTSATGPGDADIDSDDAGESGFLRNIINLQEFTTGSMKNRWGDGGLDPLTTTSNWDSNNKFFRLLFDRSYFTIPQCNNLINILNNNTFEDSELIRSEARLLRALAYFYVIDIFGKGVLATEDNLGQAELLPESSRQELFDFVESELLDIEPILPNRIAYGRVNKFVADMLLAKLYINAEVYTGTARWDDAAFYVNKVINEGGYSLEPNFILNFSGDNENSNEIIFPLLADPLTNQSYGNTTYIVNGNMNSETMETTLFGNPGGNFGWAGHRATSAWYGLFGDTETELNNSPDVRASLFWTQGHNYVMTDYREWTDGYPSTKFRNSGALTDNIPPTEFSGTDFPVYRLADAYLMYAELALRGAANTNIDQALQLVNQVRTRSNALPINQSQLTLDFLIDERGRELNLEGHRRTDLIRFDLFTGGNYLWPWKGNSPEGSAIPSTYDLFPIPIRALNANSNLTQNPGY